MAETCRERRLHLRRGGQQADQDRRSGGQSQPHRALSQYSYDNIYEFTSSDSEWQRRGGLELRRGGQSADFRQPGVLQLQRFEPTDLAPDPPRTRS